MHSRRCFGPSHDLSCCECKPEQSLNLGLHRSTFKTALGRKDVLGTQSVSARTSGSANGGPGRSRKPALHYPFRCIFSRKKMLFTSKFPPCKSRFYVSFDSLLFVQGNLTHSSFCLQLQKVPTHVYTDAMKSLLVTPGDFDIESAVRIVFPSRKRKSPDGCVTAADDDDEDEEEQEEEHEEEDAEDEVAEDGDDDGVDGEDDDQGDDDEDDGDEYDDVGEGDDDDGDDDGEGDDGEGDDGEDDEADDQDQDEEDPEDDDGEDEEEEEPASKKARR